MKKIFRFSLFALLSVVGIGFSLWLTLPSFDAAELDPTGIKQATNMPWRFEGKPDTRRMEVRFQRHIGISSTWQIIPDDYLIGISVNGKPVPLDGVSQSARRDWSQGFALDLKPWLVPGENVLIFEINNTGGPGGLQLRPHINTICMVFYAISFLLLLAALHQLMPLTGRQYYILFVGLVVLLAYWSVTPWDMRTHDVGLPTGHLGYAYWIADHLQIPRPDAGWTFYHPPLYYIVSAAILRGADLLRVSRPETLQIFSLALWMVFLSASAAALRVCLRGKEYTLLVATTALVLWPSGIIHSIRIGNDTPTYAACALASLCMVRWWKTRRRAALVGLTCWTALALLCKTSAVAMVAAGGSMLAWRILYPGREGRLCAAERTASFTLTILAALLLSQANSIYHHLKGDLAAWLVSNVGGLASGLRVPISLKSFIPLDIPTFLTTLWANPWEDASGRTNFWNYLLRDSLSGEFSFSGVSQNAIAGLWGVVVLVLCLATLHALYRAFKYGQPTTLYRMRPLLLLVGFWLSSLIALRIQAPFSCSNDFRYIVPILLPALAIAADSGKLTRGALLIISLSSSYFFTTL